MGVSLAEALGQVDLEAGQVYRCQVKGHWIELRVLEPHDVRPSALFDESDVMLDAWAEFPLPPPVARVVGRLGTMPLPDAPVIPSDEEES